MNKYAVMPSDDYKAVCDNIRKRTPSFEDAPIKSGELATKIEDVYRDSYDAGYGDGWAKGESDGHTEGFSRGMVAGKEAEWSEFWDNYQDNGNRGSYEAAFWGSGWNDITFKPKYNIYPTELNQTFRSSRITDLVAALENQNITLDTSRCTSFNYTFAVYPAFTRIGILDTRAATDLPYTFSTATVLHTIEEIILKEDGSQKFSQTFGSCASLKNIKITGCIGQNFDIKSSPLTKESIESIINALSTETTGTILSLNKSAVQKAFGTTNLDSSTEWTTLKNLKSNWTITLI